MGSGKTFTGKALAEKFKFSFIDLDSYIENKEAKTINEIFELKGESHFRETEKKHLEEIIKLDENIIVATGGGTPCFHNNIELLNKNGITFYLQASEKKLFDRLISEASQRPLIKGLSEKELRNFISEKLKEREKYYLQAKHVIDIEEKDHVEKINSFIPGN